jgi:branched-chain amino acid transport system ATP-binding protein
MLDVQNLMVFFENALALNDFSMKVEEGEIVGVIGSNSAGKTTLMNTLSGLIIDMRIKEKRRGGERITVYGKILYRGEDITETSPSDRVKKGIVLSRERHPVFPESSVVENLKIAGYLRRKSEIHATMDHVFGLFPALLHLKSRKAGFLSGGEQQMLAIARALMSSPQLLLLDEPSTGLAPKIVVSIFEIIEKIRKESDTSILLVEQNVSMALRVCNRCFILEKGNVVLHGESAGLKNDPKIKESYLGIA